MSASPNRRRGFSLIELLVVMAIMAILLGLLMGGVMRVRIRGQVRSSSDVVEKVQLAVDTQYKAVIAQAQIDIRQQSTQDARNMIDYFNGDSDAALALLTYARVRQNFPQIFAEVTPAAAGGLLPGTTTVNGVATPYFTVAGFPFFVKSNFMPFVGKSTANLNVAQQSAALLYAAVAQTGSGGASFDSDTALASAQFDFTPPVAGAITIHTYKDAWNQPIGFCRFGTNPELQSAAYVDPSAAAIPGTTVRSWDPLDPSGKLYLWQTTNIPNNQASVAVAALFLPPGDVANISNAQGFNATNRRPVVYSTGYNQIYESLDNTPAVATQAPDDILGYRLVQLGQKGTR